MNAWDHPPNAKHIDRIIADLNANPDRWRAAYTARNDAWNAAYAAVYDAASTVNCDVDRAAAYDDAWNAAWYAACGAILALVAYDDCAWMLDEKPEYLQTIMLLGNNPAAVLMYPACLALSNEKEIIND